MVTVRHIDILEDDDLFNDVKLYENDIMFKQGDGKLGFEKCIQECTGRCIEFGVTGNGICFPKSEFDYPEDN